MSFLIGGNLALPGFAEVEADEVFFGAEIEAFTGEDRAGPAGVAELGDLVAADFLDSPGIDLE